MLFHYFPDTLYSSVYEWNSNIFKRNAVFFVWPETKDTDTIGRDIMKQKFENQTNCIVWRSITYKF